MELTEYAKIRKSYGMTQHEMAREIGISGAVYSLMERGKRNLSLERAEKFYYELHHAGTRYVKEKQKKAHDLRLNTYKKVEGDIMRSMEEEIEKELDFKLHYEQLTEKKFQTALAKYIVNGLTVVRAAADLGVCEQELKRRLDREGISYEMGDNWEKLTK